MFILSAIAVIITATPAIGPAEQAAEQIARLVEPDTVFASATVNGFAADIEARLRLRGFAFDRQGQIFSAEFTNLEGRAVGVATVRVAGYEISKNFDGVTTAGSGWALRDLDPSGEGFEGVRSERQARSSVGDTDAVRRYALAGRGGDRSAATNAGILLYARDKPGEAFQMMARAANRGDPNAALSAGLALRYGDGIAPDPDQATMFLKQAKLAGVAEAGLVTVSPAGDDYSTGRVEKESALSGKATGQKVGGKRRAQSRRGRT